MNRGTAGTIALALLGAQCSSASDAATTARTHDDTGDAGDGGASSFSVGDAGSTALVAHVENPSHVALEIFTVSCAGDCADVVAVARGGHAPYSYQWEDGSTDPARRICPSSTSTFTVTATDTALDNAEFHSLPQTTTASVTAEVAGCAGGGGDGGGDAQPPAPCLTNPSFEGAMTPTQFTAFDAPPWNACYAGGFITYSAIADPTLWPAQHWTFPMASDGATYLALGQQGTVAGRTSQTLCEPITAGSSRSFLVDLARATTSDTNVEATSQVMQILGGAAECAETDVLWTSPQLTVDWATYCVTLRPQHDVTTIGFRPSGSGGGGEVEGLVDHLVPVANCP